MCKPRHRPKARSEEFVLICATHVGFMDFLDMLEHCRICNLHVFNSFECRCPTLGGVFVFAARVDRAIVSLCTAPLTSAASSSPPASPRAWALTKLCSRGLPRNPVRRTAAAQTLLAAAILALRPLTRAVIVVAGENAESLAPIVDANGAFLVRNPNPERGQFSSLQTGLRGLLTEVTTRP